MKNVRRSSSKEPSTLPCLACLTRTRASSAAGQHPLLRSRCRSHVEMLLQPQVKIDGAVYIHLSTQKLHIMGIMSSDTLVAKKPELPVLVLLLGCRWQDGA